LSSDKFFKIYMTVLRGYAVGPFLRFE
jgi:hypothetical protein